MFSANCKHALASALSSRAKRKHDKNQTSGHGVHPFFAVKGGSGQKQVDSITGRALKVVAGQTKVAF